MRGPRGLRRLRRLRWFEIRYVVPIRVVEEYHNGWEERPEEETPRSKGVQAQNDAGGGSPTRHRKALCSCPVLWSLLSVLEHLVVKEKVGGDMKAKNGAGDGERPGCQQVQCRERADQAGRKQVDKSRHAGEEAQCESELHFKVGVEEESEEEMEGRLLQGGKHAFVEHLAHGTIERRQ